MVKGSRTDPHFNISNSMTNQQKLFFFSYADLREEDVEGIFIIFLGRPENILEPDNL